MIYWSPLLLGIPLFRILFFIFLLIGGTVSVIPNLSSIPFPLTGVSKALPLLFTNPWWMSHGAVMVLYLNESQVPSKISCSTSSTLAELRKSPHSTSVRKAIPVYSSEFSDDGLQQNSRINHERWGDYKACFKRGPKDPPSCIGSSAAETRSGRTRDQSSNCCKLSTAKYSAGRSKYYPEWTKNAGFVSEVIAVGLQSWYSSDLSPVQISRERYRLQCSPTVGFESCQR